MSVMAVSSLARAGRRCPESGGGAGRERLEGSAAAAGAASATVTRMLRGQRFGSITRLLRSRRLNLPDRSDPVGNRIHERAVLRFIPVDQAAWTSFSWPVLTS